MEKNDCFAYKYRMGQGGCTALKDFYCKDCKFYRNDINQAEIEHDIENYADTYKN